MESSHLMGEKLLSLNYEGLLGCICMTLERLFLSLAICFLSRGFGPQFGCKWQRRLISSCFFRKKSELWISSCYGIRQIVNWLSVEAESAKHGFSLYLSLSPTRLNANGKVPNFFQKTAALSLSNLPKKNWFNPSGALTIFGLFIMQPYLWF